MNFPNRQYDDSSDDSDVIPPTPAAKSTPLPQGNIFRGTGSSSQRPRPGAQDDSSSEDEDTAPRSAPAAPEDSEESDDDNAVSTGSTLGQPKTYYDSSEGEAVENVKREVASGSSSEGDHTNSVRNQIKARLEDSNKRAEHAMSDSENSDDGDGHQTIQNQLNHQDDSSEESDDDGDNAHSSRKGLSVVVKRERPSTSESGEESEDETNVLGKVNSHSAHQSSGESQSEDENPRKKLQSHKIIPQTQVSGNDTSSEESNDETEQKPLLGRPHHTPVNDSSSEESDDEVEQKPVLKKSHQAPVNNSSSDESESEVEETQIKSNPTHSKKNTNDSEDDSEDDEPVQNPKFNLKSGNDSSEEESSEDEATTKPIISKKSRKDPSEEELSDSEKLEKLMAQASSSHPNRQPPLSESEESDDENTSGVPNSSLGQPREYYDSSENEADHKTDNKVIKQIDQSQIQKPLVDNTRINFPRNRPIQQVRVPVSDEKGLLLLQETFQDKEPLQVDDASLSVEDIGSDDEIWLLQCPYSMDISALKKRSINLSSENEIQMEDGPTFKRFSIIPQKKSNDSINCLLPLRSLPNQFQISCLPIKGKVVINEHIHVPKLRLPEAGSKECVPFPSGLKVRHPLLGTEYKQHIADARKTLQESALLQRQIAKKKKRSLENSHSNLIEQSNGKKKRTENQTELLTVNSKGKISLIDEGSGKKKRKSSLNGDVSDNGSLSSLQVPSKKKKSMKGIEGNLSEGEKRHSWHIPQEEEMPTSVLASNTESHSKKKKKKSSKELISPSSIKQEKVDYSEHRTSEMLNTEVKAQKRKRKEDQNSVTVDSSQIPSKKKKYSL